MELNKQKLMAVGIAISHVHKVLILQYIPDNSNIC